MYCDKGYHRDSRTHECVSKVVTSVEELLMDLVKKHHEIVPKPSTLNAHKECRHYCIKGYKRNAQKECVPESQEISMIEDVEAT